MTYRYSNPEQLVAANRARKAQAAEVTVPAAKAAVDAIRHVRPRTKFEANIRAVYLPVLQARVKAPTRTLAQLAASLGMTKDTYSARLRRALRYGQKLQSKVAA